MAKAREVDSKEKEKKLSVQKLRTRRIELLGEIANGEQKKRELETQLERANDSITFLRGAVAALDELLNEE